jgi:hypothetical protein
MYANIYKVMPLVGRIFVTKGEMKAVVLFTNTFYTEDVKASLSYMFVRYFILSLNAEESYLRHETRS